MSQGKARGYFLTPYTVDTHNTVQKNVVVAKKNDAFLFIASRASLVNKCTTCIVKCTSTRATREVVYPLPLLHTT